mmetsp:Transcript_24136/g.39326  ORF Transcript_24136/g.39326 Transcript_24136/m.39326 type:complete len:86 (+) Transcript_24136:814-1071(+)
MFARSCEHQAVSIDLLNWRFMAKYENHICQVRTVQGILNKIRNWILWRGLHMDDGHVLDTLKSWAGDAEEKVAIPSQAARQRPGR